MFCVYQVDDKMNEKIIKVVKTKTEFIDAIKEKIIDQFTIKSLEGITENDLKLNECFKDGYYLLMNDRQIKLVNKYRKIEKGYVFNSSSADVNVVFMWKMIPSECHDLDVDSHCEAEFTFADSESSQYYMDELEPVTESKKENDIQVKLYNGKTLAIKGLDLNDLPERSSICLLGKRNSGKSLIIKNIIDRCNTTDDFVDNCLILCGNEKNCEFYREQYPSAKILPKYDRTALDDFIERASENIRKNGKNVNNGCVVLDDCLASNGNWMNDGSILELFYNGRHYGITFIVSMQFSLGIRPELRCNFDYVFLLDEPFYSNQKILYDHYSGFFPSFDLFRETFVQLTENYRSMVIVNCGSRTDITDKVFHYKAHE